MIIGTQKRMVNIYRFVAIISFTVAIFFLLLNGLAWSALKLRIEEDAYSRAQKKYDKFLPDLYPGKSKDEIELLWREMGSRPFVFEPFIDYRNRPYKGKYVNVSSVGFRKSIPAGPWPPDAKNYNVFLFGGSTTFGWGVEDEQTIASYLQKKLRKKNISKNIYVYNFGTESYYSTIERIRFEQLLLKYQPPDMAIFVDGRNDFSYYDDDHATAEQIRQSFLSDRFKLSFILPRIFNSLPINTFIQKQILKSKEPSKSDFRNTHSDSAVVSHIIDRYLKNKMMIESVARAYEVQTYFVWQPVPNYKNNLARYLFIDVLKPEYIGGLIFAPGGYDIIAQMNQNGQLGTHFIYCAQIQEKLDMLMYIDSNHYSGPFSEKVAECIRDGIGQF